MKKNILTLVALLGVRLVALLGALVIIGLLPASIISAAEGAASASAFRDAALPVEQRAEDLLGRLSLEEKVFLCHGNDGKKPEERFVSGGVARLGIPPIRFLDGRVGVRTFDKSPRTALPCTLSLSCAWDLEAARDYARVLAGEMQASGAQVLFAPGLNLMRDSRGGRNFEYLGEDPFLCGIIGTEYIKELQSRRIAGCAVILVANDCERLRHMTSSNLSERTLREMHFRPFEMAVREGGVWTAMAANSLVNGVHAAANRPLLQTLLKDRVGFDGVVLSDWRAAYDTAPSALAGLDMTTGICAYVFGDGNLLRAVRDGSVSQALLDDKARRIIRLYIRTGLLDSPAPAMAKPGMNLPAHAETARRLAAEGMVLLKNDRDLLPLDVNKIKSLAVTGPGATYVAFGVGSGRVFAPHMTTPLDGLKQFVKDKAGGRGEREGKADIFHFAWTGPQPGRRGEKFAFPAAPEITDAARARLAAADAIVFCAVDAPHGESTDLDDIKLPGGQVEAIRALAAINPHVIVVLQIGQPVLLKDVAGDANVPSILVAWYAGQETGSAIADIIFGAVNPSGKLSSTFARVMEDYPCEALKLWPPKIIVSAKDRPLNAGSTNPAERKALHAVDANYDEGVFIGYRWLDRQGAEPLFVFGHGLSYTKFSMSGCELLKNGSGDSLRVACVVTNIGKRAGSEVAQVYVAPPAPAKGVNIELARARPVRELKGFARVTLQPGESRRVEIALPRDALCRYDEEKSGWVVDAGEYNIEVGVSSRDIKARLPVKIASSFLLQ